MGKKGHKRVTKSQEKQPEKQVTQQPIRRGINQASVLDFTKEDLERQRLTDEALRAG